MEEALSFFQDIKGQDNQNESNIGLMNQLFDGHGDKTSLAQLRQRYIPINSTSMCLGVQPQPLFKDLMAIGNTVWMNSGFAEYFLFTTVRPFRYLILKHVLHATGKKVMSNIGDIYLEEIFGTNIQQKYSVEIFNRNIQI